MEDIIRFLEQLRRHNNREWFEANKLWYRDVKARFDGLVARLIDAIAAFDPSVAGLAVKDCTYRIYRDTRFSPNKEPYKTHFGAYFCPRGKKSGYAGYYFHVEPQGDGLIGGHLLSAGLYMPEPNVLKSVRDEIFDNGERFVERGEPAETGAGRFSVRQSVCRIPETEGRLFGKVRRRPFYVAGGSGRKRCPRVPRDDAFHRSVEQGRGLCP